MPAFAYCRGLVARSLSTVSGEAGEVTSATSAIPLRSSSVLPASGATTTMSGV